MALRPFVLSALLGLVLAGPAPDQPAPRPACAAISAANADDCLRINQLQVVGTHNSYHVAPEPPVLAALGERSRAIDYTHRPLTYQLDALGVRQFEIDVYADPRGGQYATPRLTDLAPGLEHVGRPGPEMQAPGLKVLHGPQYDFRSTCTTFRRCLTEIRDWSRAHPRHVPIVVLVEVKDQAPSRGGSSAPNVAVPFDAAQLDGLDAEIRAVFDEAHLLTPDDVRGRAATLREAIATGGWPTLRDARGKVLFAMDNTGVHRDTYLAGRRTLEGRVLFVSVEPPHPAAAFQKLNDAMPPATARITDAVRAGFLVRTRADEPGREARTGDTTRRDAAFRSGAQLVSTDYPEPSPYASGRGYVVRLPGVPRGTVARCNPVSAPPGCRDEWLAER